MQRVHGLRHCAAFWHATTKSGPGPIDEKRWGGSCRCPSTPPNILAELTPRLPISFPCVNVATASWVGHWLVQGELSASVILLSSDPPDSEPR